MKSPQEQKDEGNRAYSSGDFSAAINFFSAAISESAGVGENEFLKVCFSNRSAANLQLKKLQEALADASTCVELDQQWPKGWLRKGDALLASKSFTQAYNAYNQAKRLNPSDASIEGKLEQAMGGIRQEADRTSPRSTSSTSSSAATASPSGNARFTTVMTYARYFLLLCAILSIPPLGIKFYCFKAFSLISLVIYGLRLYSRNGFPQFNSNYAIQLFADEDAILFFQSAILVMSKPYITALGPIVLTELSRLIGENSSFLQDNPTFVQMKPLMDRFFPSLSHMDFASPVTFNKIRYALTTNAAVCEVVHGVFLLLEMLLPTRNMMMTVIWWQYLQMHYMLETTRSGNEQSRHLKAAFAMADQRLSALIAHRMCPKIVGRGYSMLQKFMADKVKPQSAPASGAGTSGISSMMNKCSVM